MFQFNALLSQFSIALFIYHGRWIVIYAKASAFEAKAKKFGLKAKVNGKD